MNYEDYLGYTDITSVAVASVVIVFILCLIGLAFHDFRGVAVWLLMQLI